MSEAEFEDDDRVAATQSIVGRITAATTAAALIAVAILFVITYSVVADGLTRALASGVDADLAGLADIYATGGRDELLDRIRDRNAMTAVDGRAAHYAVRENGRIVAGDQRRWPILSAARSDQGYVTLDGDRSGYARATALGPDLDLLVAREDRPERATLHRLTLAFAASGVALVVIALALAWWRSRRLARRLARINRAYRDADDEAIESLTGDPRPDEIGELARRSGGALARVRRLLDAQRHVSDHVAHELRTPLLHLEGRLRGLLRNNPDATTAEAVALASADVRGITAMLDAMLDIAASEASRGDRAGMARFDLSALVADLAELYRGSMEDADLTFEPRIAPGVSMVGEPMQISRLIVNLLDNAAKYVPPGGTVRLELAPGPLLVVEDDGPGIAPHLVPNVFDRFQRAAEHANAPGHGLGLALARAIAQRHELDLSLDTGGGGARFVIQPESGK
jgi:signal transduction histidine kinase